MANAVTLTPGTMTLTARLDPAELHIHVLGLDDADEFRASVHDLERRTVAALTPSARPPRAADAPTRRDLMNVVTAIALGLLAVAAALCFARAIRPGTIIDRAIALDGVVSAIICGVAIAAVRTGSGILDRHRPRRRAARLPHAVDRRPLRRAGVGL